MMKESKATKRIIGEEHFPGRFLRAALDDAADMGPLTILNIALEAIDTVDEAARQLTADDGDVVAVLHDGVALPDSVEALRNTHCLTVLRCPAMVGTGMTGLWRDVVNAIYRGFYFHIEGNEARRATVHALDVARAACLAAGRSGDFILGDDRCPRFEDMAEALSFRLNHKRIPRLSPRKARLLHNIARIAGWSKTERRLRLQTTDYVPDTSAWAAAFPCFRFMDVADYLKNHIYGQDDI